jgi:tetratricopeptide (TPR) repeat protein
LIRSLKAKLFFFLGRRLQSRRVALALKFFQRAAALQPTRVNPIFQIAWCLSNLKDYEKALAMYDQVLQKAPRFGEARAQRALALAGLTRYQAAVDELNRARSMGFNEEGKKIAFWDGRLGWWLYSLRRYEEAIEPLKRAIALQPKNARLHSYLGGSYGELQRYDEAAKELQEAVRLDPASAQDHRYLGAMFLATKQFDKAVDSLLQALKLQPNDAVSHYNLGAAYRELGRVEDEISEYKKVLEITPNDTGALINLALTYGESGQSESAVDTWKQPFSAIRTASTRTAVSRTNMSRSNVTKKLSSSPATSTGSSRIPLLPKPTSRRPSIARGVFRRPLRKQRRSYR